MEIRRHHTGIALFLALLLHTGLLFLLAIPSSPPQVTVPPPLHVRMLPMERNVEPVPQPVKLQPRYRPTPSSPSRPVRRQRAENQKRVEKKAVLSPPRPVPQPPSTSQPTMDIPDSPPVPAKPRVTEPKTMADSMRYETLVSAWLERHKRYPRRARRLRIEGEGWLRIRLDRDGRVLRMVLEQSTGNRLLDRAALEMIRRANPFPSFPEQDSRQEREFLVPVAFQLY